MDATAARTLAPEAFRRLSAVVMMPVPSGLVRTSASPFLNANVAYDPIGVNDSRHRHPVLELFIDDRVPADDHRPRCADPFGPAVDNVGEYVENQLALGESHDVQCRFRLRAHRIDVAQCIGGGDLAERVGVVYDRGKEVDGIDDGEIGPKAKHSRVVGRLRADNHVRVFKRRETVQHLQQVGRAELARSTSRRDLLCEPHQLNLLASGDLRHHASTKTVVPLIALL